MNEPSEGMVRITFTLGVSGRFIDMNRDEAEIVHTQLGNILNKEPKDANQLELPFN